MSSYLSESRIFADDADYADFKSLLIRGGFVGLRVGMFRKHLQHKRHNPRNLRHPRKSEIQTRECKMYNLKGYATRRMSEGIRDREINGMNAFWHSPGRSYRGEEMAGWSRFLSEPGFSGLGVCSLYVRS